MKRFFKKLHLWLSVPFGIIITIVCLSGAALVFESEITESLNPGIYKLETPENGRPMTPSQLMAKVRQQLPDTLVLSSLRMSEAKDRPWMVGFKNVRRRQLSVNQYTGEVKGWTPQYSFFKTMRTLHRWLMNPPAKKGAPSVGKYVVGVSTLVFVFVLISGVVIWWPRRRKMLKDRLTFSVTKGWWRFWYESHLAWGAYATIFLLLMALTGLTWSFGWYRTAAYTLFGADMGKKEMPGGNKGKADGKKKKEPQVNVIAWDNVVRQLNRQYSSFAYIQLEGNEAAVCTSEKGLTRKTDKVEFDADSGKIKKVRTSDSTPKQNKLKGLFYSLHTGSWGGVTTKILYLLSAIIGAVLPISGYYLWIKRIRRKKKK